MSNDMRYTRTYFKSVIEIPDLAETVEELVDTCFIIFYKGVQSDHVDLLRI